MRAPLAVLYSAAGARRVWIGAGSPGAGSPLEGALEIFRITDWRFSHQLEPVAGNGRSGAKDTTASETRQQQNQCKAKKDLEPYYG